MTSKSRSDNGPADYILDRLGSRMREMLTQDTPTDIPQDWQHMLETIEARLARPSRTPQ